MEVLGDKRFRILSCIDGSDESYRGLHYAARLGSGVDADIVLLYVRAVDQDMRSGGLQPRVFRENLLHWGLDLPGIKYLNKAREDLAELGIMSDHWTERAVHVDRQGDPLGDNSIEYTNRAGKKIALKLKVAPDIVEGILEECETSEYDLLILGASERWRPGRRKSFWDPAVAEKVVARAPCSVIVARELKENYGHMICTNGSEHAIDVARKDAILASRCQCPISLISVVPEGESEAKAMEALVRTREAIEAEGVVVEEVLPRVGDTVDEIVEAGARYSVIVIAPSEIRPKWWLLETDIAFQVMEHAHNSVMIVR
jgi:nucleotide-binding universal stress UspA family protein